MWNHDWVQGYLRAGETYGISAITWDDTISEVSYIAEKATTATGVRFQQTEYTGYVGQRIDAKLFYEPANGLYEDMEYTISDGDGNAELIDPWRVGTGLNLTQAGTFTLTATSQDSDLTASCTITVLGENDITVGLEKYWEIQPGESIELSFTAPADGNYTVWCSDSWKNWLRIEVFDENNQQVSLSWQRNSFAAEAGKTYRIVLQNHDESVWGFELHLDEAVPATDLRLDYNYVTIPVGMEDEVILRMEPSCADRTKVTWSVSDSSVIELLEETQNNFRFRGLKAGKTIITVKDGYGSSGKYTLRVVDPIELTEGETVTVSIDSEYGHYFTFTPSEDGDYVIHRADGEGSWIRLWGSDVNVSNNDRIQVYLHAGETYYISAGFWDGNESTASIIAEKAISATGVSFQQAQYSGYAGETISAELEFEPVSGRIESMEYTISGGTGAAEIEGYMESGVLLRLTQAGTFTLTATSVDSDLTASCTITVLDENVIVVGLEKYLQIQPSESIDLSFTAPADGNYTVWCYDSWYGWPRIEVFDENDQQVSLSWLRNSFAAEAGKTYRIVIQNYSENAWAFDLHLDEAVPATDLSLDYNHSTIPVGMEDSATLWMDPSCGDRTKVTWSVSDSSVIEILEETQNNLRFRGLKAGETIITVKDGYGRSDNYTLRVADPVVLTEGEAVTMKMAHGVEQCFTFTPSVDGNYIFRCVDTEVHDIHLWGPDTDESDSNRVQVFLRANKTYYINVRSWNSGVSEASYIIEQAVEATGVHFQREQYSGYVTEYIDIKLIFEPGNALTEEMVYTISGTGSAEILGGSGAECAMRLKEVGTFTLTATSQNSDLTASCTITVMDPPTWELNETKSLSLMPYDGDNSQLFRFTAPESTGYIVWQEDGAWDWIRVTNAESDLESVNGGGFCQFDAQEGETYYIEVQSNYYEPTQDILHLDPLVPCEGIAPRNPEQANMTAFSGDSHWLMLDFTPGNASRGQIEWTSDNPDSVEVLYASMDDCEVLMKEPGTATITATHQRVEGVSTSFTITVQEVDELQVDTPVSVTMAGQDSSCVYDFTAPEDATYVIYDQNAKNCGISVDAMDGYDNTSYWGNRRVQFTAQKGQTYRVTFYNWNDFETTYSYVVTKAVPATKIGFDWVGTPEGFVGERIWLSVVTEPMNADISGLTWYSSNEAVAVLEDGESMNRGIQLVGEGTAIITIRLGDLQASIKVISREPMDIQEGEDINFTLEPWTDQGIRFTTSESGYYTLWNKTGAPCNFYLYESDGSFIDSTESSAVLFEAEAGKTYLCAVGNHTDESHDYTIRMEKSVQATSISLPFTEEDVCVGEIHGRSLDYAPVNAIPEEIIWTVEPADAANILMSTYGHVYFEVLKAGTFTLTATTADGRLCSSCTYNATVPPVITTDGIVDTFPAHWVQSYQFTPTQSGMYSFWAEADERITMMVTDPESKEVHDGDLIHMDLTGGVTYIVSVVNINDSPVEAQIHVQKAVDVERVSLSFLDLDTDRVTTGVNAFTGENIHLELCAEPHYAYLNNVTWTVSSEDVAQLVWYSDFGCDVQFLKAGTVTITANVNGLEVSQTFTVSEPTTISNGFKSGDVELTYGDRLGYRFTPTESGTYLFRDEYYNWTDIMVCEENGNHIDFVSNYVQFDAEAGKTYLIIPRNINDTHVSSFRLEKCVDVTTITLSEQAFTGYTGEILWIDAIFTPDNSYRNGLSWQVDNEEVIQIQNSYSSRAEVRLVGAGTATVTATVGDLSASCTVTVKTPDAIHVGDIKTVSLDYGEKVGYLFTPAESGTYVFWNEAQRRVYYELYDENVNMLWNGGGNRLVFDAEAGQSYNILVYSYRKATHSFHLDMPAQALGLTIEGGDTIYEYVDQGLVMEANVNPGNGMLGALEWTSSNPEVLEITEYDPNETVCYFYTKGVGESTLTVVDTLNGFEDSVQVIIRAPQALTLGQTVHVTQETTNSYSCMTFTPKTDGTYVLTVDTDAAVQTWVYTRESGVLAMETLDSDLKELQLELNGGTTYYVETMLHSADGAVITGSYDLTISQPDAQEPVAIISQPSDYVGALNSNASFTVAVNREDVTYQWYFSTDGATWKKSSSTGFNTDTLTIKMTSARLGQRYRCEITDSDGNTVVSDAVTMMLPPSTIQIQTQPVDFYGAVGDASPFTVEATGEGLTYRWYYSTTGGETWALSYSSGCETETLALVLRAYNSGRMYKCLITDANGNTEWTNAVTMALASGDIVIRTQPVSYTGAINDLTQFTTEAEGTNLTYQWYVSQDGGSTWAKTYNTGYNTPSLSVRLYSYRSGYQYKCVITSGNSVSVETDVATIAMRPITLKITEQPRNAGGPVGSNVTFHVGATGNGLSYQWQFSKNGGESWGNTSMTGGKTDTVTVPVTAARDGTQYRCVITDDSGTSQATNAAVLRVGAAPVITGHPESYNGPAGGTATFTVIVEGENLTYQWQYSNTGGSTWSNSGAAGATTASIDVKATTARNGQQYRCIVTNEYGSIVSEPATLTIA